jgi:hypothetical protein
LETQAAASIGFRALGPTSPFHALFVHNCFSFVSEYIVMKKSVLHHCDTTRPKIEMRRYKEFSTTPNI